jgi:hypothetical protein
LANAAFAEPRILLSPCLKGYWAFWVVGLEIHHIEFKGLILALPGGIIQAFE